MGFNSILIGSENPERLVEDYTRVLGKPTFSDGGYTGWQLGSGFVTVGPHSEVKGKNTTPWRIIWNVTMTLPLVPVVALPNPVADQPFLAARSNSLGPA